MKQSQHRRAVEILDEVTTRALTVRTGYLRLHAAGELREYEQAAEAHRNLPKETSPMMQELQDELRRRYVDRLPPEHTDEWCFDRQAMAFLLAA